MDYLAEVEKAIKNIKTINNPPVTVVIDKPFDNELDKTEKEMIEKNYKKPWSKLNADQKTKLLLDYSKAKNADFSVLKNGLRDKIISVKYNQEKMAIDEVNFVESKIKVKEIEKEKNKITELNIE
jgi:hypothetical protein